MPNFTDTKAQYVAARNAAEAIVATVERSVDLGQRYTLTLKVNRQDGVFTYAISHDTNKNEALNINRIPVVVIMKVSRVVKLIRDWRQDQLPDFPDLDAA